MVADGSGVWVSRPGAVTKLLPDGSVGMTVAVPALPGDMVVAGDSLWMTVPDAGLIAKVDRSDGTVDTYRLGGRPASIASAKGLIWVTDIESNRLFEVDASTAKIIREIETGSSPLGVYSDGDTIWVANSESNSVTAVDASGEGVRQFRVPASPTDLAVHEGVLWVVSERGHTLSAIDVLTAEVKRTLDLGGGPLKLEIHPPYVVVTNPGLGLIQNVPLTQSSAPPSTSP